ncbi:GtrA family protein [Halorubrum saccharovorum]|nr:GtrA family protein [Halorubrum saccharovorum]
MIPDYLEPLLSRVQFGKFVSVGAVGAIIDTTVLTTTTLILNFPDLLGKAAGIEAAVIIMFIINERWTFSNKGSPKKIQYIKRLGKSHVVRSGGITIQLIVYWILIQWIDISVIIIQTDLWFILASFFSIGLAMLVNYTFESIFTWKVHN